MALALAQRADARGPDPRCGAAAARGHAHVEKLGAGGARGRPARHRGRGRPNLSLSLLGILEDGGRTLRGPLAVLDRRRVRAPPRPASTLGGRRRGRSTGAGDGDLPRRRGLRRRGRGRGASAAGRCADAPSFLSCESPISPRSRARGLQELEPARSAGSAAEPLAVRRRPSAGGARRRRAAAPPRRAAETHTAHTRRHTLARHRELGSSCVGDADRRVRRAAQRRRAAARCARRASERARGARLGDRAVRSELQGTTWARAPPPPAAAAAAADVRLGDRAADHAPRRRDASAAVGAGEHAADAAVTSYGRTAAARAPRASPPPRRAAGGAGAVVARRRPPPASRRRSGRVEPRAAKATSRASPSVSARIESPRCTENIKVLAGTHAHLGARQHAAGPGGRGGRRVRGVAIASKSSAGSSDSGVACGSKMLRDSALPGDARGRRRAFRFAGVLLALRRAAPKGVTPIRWKMCGRQQVLDVRGRAARAHESPRARAFTSISQRQQARCPSRMLEAEALQPPPPLLRAPLLPTLRRPRSSTEIERATAMRARARRRMSRRRPCARQRPRATTSTSSRASLARVFRTRAGGLLTSSARCRTGSRPMFDASARRRSRPVAKADEPELLGRRARAIAARRRTRQHVDPEVELRASRCARRLANVRRRRARRRPDRAPLHGLLISRMPRPSADAGGSR